MDYSTYIPIWNKLTDAQRASLSESAREVHYKRGDFVHNGDDCMGPCYVRSTSRVHGL